MTPRPEKWARGSEEARPEGQGLNRRMEGEDEEGREEEGGREDEEEEVLVRCCVVKGRGKLREK